MTLIGVLSDTHLQAPDNSFRQRCLAAFSACDLIIHAGDLTDYGILSAFAGKEVIAVSGNMCNYVTQQQLPERRLFSVAGHTIAVTHGAGPRHNIVDRVYSLFPEADCIIYGHTHTAALERIGLTWLLNPGSFQGSGRHGSPASYAIIRIDKSGLHPSLHTLPPTP